MKKEGSKMTKIREILEKYQIDTDIDRGTAWSFPFVCIVEKDFDKLEKELIEYVKKENCEAYGEGFNDCKQGGNND